MKKLSKSTKGANQARIKKEKDLFLEQLKRTPVVQVVAEKLGIGRSTFYNWKKGDEEFTKKVEEAIIDGIFLVNDLAESQLISSVKDKDMRAISMWLKANHPRYGNKLEISTAVKDDGSLTPEQEAVVRKALSMASFNKNDLNQNGK